MKLVILLVLCMAVTVHAEPNVRITNASTNVQAYVIEGAGASGPYTVQPSMNLDLTVPFNGGVVHLLSPTSSPGDYAGWVLEIAAYPENSHFNVTAAGPYIEVDTGSSVYYAASHYVEVVPVPEPKHTFLMGFGVMMTCWLFGYVKRTATKTADMTA